MACGTAMIRAIIAWVFSLALLGTAYASEDDPQVTVVVDTTELTLAVMRGAEVLDVYDNIAIGSNGSTRSKLMGYEKTPLGQFTITEIRESKRFTVFLALDYPDLDHVQRAYAKGYIEADEFAGLKRAIDRGIAPPQNTPLGGHIGIHGIGAGDVEIHENFNWTNGCVALTNEQLQQLLAWVSPGTTVLIQ